MAKEENNARHSYDKKAESIFDADRLAENKEHEDDGNEKSKKNLNMSVENNQMEEIGAEINDIIIEKEKLTIKHGFEHECTADAKIDENHRETTTENHENEQLDSSLGVDSKTKTKDASQKVEIMQKNSSSVDKKSQNISKNREKSLSRESRKSCSVSRDRKKSRSRSRNGDERRFAGDKTRERKRTRSRSIEYRKRDRSARRKSRSRSRSRNRRDRSRGWRRSRDRSSSRTRRLR